MRFASILSTGRYVPETRLDNAYFNELLGREVDQWLIDNVGIKSRHVMAEDEVTSDLATHAGRQALKRAGIAPEAVDIVIVATDTPDYISPATAVVVHHKLGLKSTAGALDVNAACSGWVSAVDLGARFIMTDAAIQYVLVVGAYGMSRFTDYSDHKTCTLFADGAGAVVLGASDRPGFLAGARRTFGEHHEGLGVFAGGTAQPAAPAEINGGVPRVEFVKRFPPTFNAENWPPLIYETVARAGVTVDEIDFYLMTQLNVNTIKEIMGIIQQPLRKTHWIMDKWGYTGSACIPMALDDALGQGRGPQAGDLALFIASGGGIAMACTIWRWG